MNDINQLIDAEEIVLEKFKSRNEAIVLDGAVSWKDYLESSIRIMFVLKEANGGENWDLREFLRNGGRPATWNNIIRWIKGIRNIKNSYVWSEIDKISEEDRIFYLKSIVAINVKKISGSSVANNENIYSFAKKDSDLLKEQVSIYKPQLVICCGTCCEYFDFIYDGEPVWKMTKRGVSYVSNNGQVIIDFNHPEARVSSNYLYYALIDAIKEIYVE